MQQGDIEAIVALSLRAWEPVYQSFKNVLGEAIYRHIFPEWRSHQANVVESMCRNSELYSGLVGEVDGVVGGFLLYELKRETRTGEIQLLAVDPNYQRLGLSLRLNSAALEIFRKQNAGHLVLVSSISGVRGMPKAQAAYSASKAGLTALGQGLQAEFANSPISVSIVAPGYIETRRDRGREGLGTGPRLAVDADRGGPQVPAGVDQSTDDLSTAPLWMPFISPRAIATRCR